MLDIKFEDFRKPKYRMAKGFHEGLAIVITHENKYGFMNKAGKEVIACQFHGAKNFSEGLASVQNESRLWGCINHGGELVIPYQYREVGNFKSGLAVVRDINDYYGYINQEGKEVISCRFKDARSFEDGYGIVRDDNDMYHYIDKEGNLSKPYDECFNFDNGSAVVNEEGKFHLIGKDFQIKKELPDTISLMFHSSCGMRLFQNRYDKCGYIDHEGNSTIPIYRWKREFRDDIAVNMIEDVWGFLHKELNFFPFSSEDHYDGVGDFSEGFATIRKGSQYGYIDKKGRELKSCQYQMANRFSEGLALVITEEGRTLYIDKKGNPKLTIPDLYCSRFTYGENEVVLTSTTAKGLRKLKLQKLEEIKKACVGEIDVAKQELKAPQYVLKENQ